MTDHGEKARIDESSTRYEVIPNRRANGTSEVSIRRNTMRSNPSRRERNCAGGMRNDSLV